MYISVEQAKTYPYNYGERVKIMKHLSSLYLIFLVIMLTGCQTSFSDLSSQQKPTLITLDEKGDYWSPAWVSDDFVIFNYAVSLRDSLSSAGIPDLRSYNLRTKTWRKISVPSDQNCRRLSFRSLQRLPNQSLGFVRVCDNYGDETMLIQAMDIGNGEIKTIANSGVLRAAGPFSFSQDMSEFVQENMIGPGLNNQIFYRKDDTSTQIVPDFIRAMNPSWSPHDRVIAFWGTENYAGGKPEEFKTLPEILGLNSSPWDLYLALPDGSSPKKILSSVSNPRLIKWSPKKEKIAFAGEFSGVPGIWLVDSATSQVTRIWAKSSEFDWSPDGSKMVILDQETDKDGKITSQNISIISIP